VKRSLQRINEQYIATETDPWGIDWRGTMAIRNRFYERMVAEAIGGLEPRPAELRILDVGCGSGLLSEQLRSSISEGNTIDRYLAVDVSESAIARARSLHPQSVIEYRVIDEDLTELSGEEFDLILGFEFLPYHSHEERCALFHQLKRFCHDGTRLVLSSNVRFGESDDVYVAVDQLAAEMTPCFDCLLTRDLFLSTYIDKFECHLLTWQHQRLVGGLVRWLLARRTPPACACRVVQSLAGPRWPRHRNRTFILK